MLIKKVFACVPISVPELWGCVAMSLLLKTERYERLGLKGWVCPIKKDWAALDLAGLCTKWLEFHIVTYPLAEVKKKQHNNKKRFPLHTHASIAAAYFVTGWTDWECVFSSVHTKNILNFFCVCLIYFVFELSQDLIKSLSLLESVFMSSYPNREGTLPTPKPGGPGLHSAAMQAWSLLATLCPASKLSVLLHLWVQTQLCVWPHHFSPANKPLIWMINVLVFFFLGGVSVIVIRHYWSCVAVTSPSCKLVCKVVTSTTGSLLAKPSPCWLSWDVK